MKNLKKVYNSWRLVNPLTLNEVEVIEHSCSEMMYLYGYDLVFGSRKKFENLNLDFVDASHSMNLVRLN